MKIASDRRSRNDDELSAWSCANIMSMAFPAKTTLLATLNLTVTLTLTITHCFYISFRCWQFSHSRPKSCHGWASFFSHLNGVPVYVCLCSGDDRSEVCSHLTELCVRPASADVRLQIRPRSVVSFCIMWWAEIVGWGREERAKVKEGHGGHAPRIWVGGCQYNCSPLPELMPESVVFNLCAASQLTNNKGVHLFMSLAKSGISPPLKIFGSTLSAPAKP